MLKINFLMQNLWSGLLIPPKIRAAVTPATVLDLCNKLSFIQTCYFLMPSHLTPILESCSGILCSSL